MSNPRLEQFAIDLPRRGDAIYFYAEKPWEQLRAERLRGSRRLGLGTIRGLVELLSAAGIR